MRPRSVVCALLTGLVLGAPSLSASLASPARQEEGAVLAVLQQAFDAMAADDAEALRAVLLPTGSSYSVRGAGELRAQTNAEWIATTGTNEQKFLERMWDQTVRVEGDTAMVWTPYDFWIDGAFSHCGIDIVTFLRAEGAWKIATFTYTVVRDGCAPSPLGPPR